MMLEIDEKEAAIIIRAFLAYSSRLGDDRPESWWTLNAKVNKIHRELLGDERILDGKKP